MSFNRNDLQTVLGDTPTDGPFDLDKPVEIQTDKENVKLAPCRECRRPLVVTTFFAPAKALCVQCKGESPTQSKGAVGQPVPGQTDPAKAVNLADCLVNPHFAQALCPVHPDDESHVMELKSVDHAKNYGPQEFAGYDRGLPVYRQLAVGEVAMHQCLKCKATVTYSTTAQHQYRRQNEAREKHSANTVHESLLGVRQEDVMADAA